MQRKCLHEWGWFCAASVGGSVCILGRISTPVVTYNVSIMVVQLVDKNCSRLLGFKKPCRQRGLAGCTRKEDHHWGLFVFQQAQIQERPACSCRFVPAASTPVKINSGKYGSSRFQHVASQMISLPPPSQYCGYQLWAGERGG